MSEGFNWQERAAKHLIDKYGFAVDNANELADALFYNTKLNEESPEEYVDEEMTYWGD